jgi:anti-sigma regulatory factor (Ser/Thr protein kinase)
VKNDLGELEGLLEGVANWGKGNALSEEIIYELSLIVDEVVSNIIRHGYRDGMEHPLTLELALDGSEMLIRVVDQGVHFNPLLKPDPDTSKPMEERKPGGLRIYMVKHLVDNLDYRRENGRNYLIIRKGLRKD